jgi:hypothetical protein
VLLPVDVSGAIEADDDDAPAAAAAAAVLALVAAVGASGTAVLARRGEISAWRVIMSKTRAKKKKQKSKKAKSKKQNARKKATTTLIDSSQAFRLHTRMNHTTPFSLPTAHASTAASESASVATVGSRFTEPSR